MSQDYENLIEAFRHLPEVEAIALGGSRATGCYEEGSDYDVYVYLNAPLAVDTRRVITDKYCSYMELNNQFWETEDDGILTDGVEIELIYRDLDWLEVQMDNLLVYHYCSTGYSTCLWANLLDCRVLFDRHSRLTSIKHRYDIPFPRELQENIILKNAPLLKYSMPAYYRQLSKAYIRGDWNSVNHRFAEMMATYFDILFALNVTPHPGEKRLESLAAQLDILPENFLANLSDIWKVLLNDADSALMLIEKLITSLEKLLHSKGYDIR